MNRKEQGIWLYVTCDVSCINSKLYVDFGSLNVDLSPVISFLEKSFVLR